MNKQERQSVSSPQLHTDSVTSRNIFLLLSQTPTGALWSTSHICSLPSSAFHLCCHIISIALCFPLFFSVALFVTRSSFSYNSISIPSSLTPSFSVSHNAKWQRHSKCVRVKTGPGVGKRRQTKDNRAQAILFKQTLDGMGLRIAVVSQTWLA